MEGSIKPQRPTPGGPESDYELQMIADAIQKSSNIVVITGAGISTDAGISVSPLM
jgi:hypothetical protein